MLADERQIERATLKITERFEGLNRSRGHVTTSVNGPKNPR